jgi:hypothetical protein
MAHPFPLFEQMRAPPREVLVTPEIISGLEGEAALAIEVTGGKDSAATAQATIDYLEDVGHRGPRVSDSQRPWPRGVAPIAASV